MQNAPFFPKNHSSVNGCLSFPYSNILIDRQTEIYINDYEVGVPVMDKRPNMILLMADRMRADCLDQCLIWEQGYRDSTRLIVGRQPQTVLQKTYC